MSLPFGFFLDLAGGAEMPALKKISHILDLNIILILWSIAGLTANFFQIDIIAEVVLLNSCYFSRLNAGQIDDHDGPENKNGSQNDP